MSFDVDELLYLAAFPTRAEILNVVQKFDPICVSRISEVLSLTQNQTSKHLTKMREAGLVKADRTGRTVYYRLAEEPCLRDFLEWRRRYRQ